MKWADVSIVPGYFPICKSPGVFLPNSSAHPFQASYDEVSICFRQILLDSYRLDDITNADVTHNIHSRSCIAENRVVRWKAGLILEADEELAAVGIWAGIS